ncbi:DUF7220 family protein [Pseudogemmobacter sp. W21_MBD1_M6]|uniref:DUF7220 family protein n=1 Tax=Pseudogemmobacter sp. W21_MBD1_M6 TaxID=3240271 RepID=UPI003F9B8F59
MQSRLMSLVEAVTNVLVGFLVAFGVQVVTFPLLGIEARTVDHFMLGGVFTVASVVRSYVIRRGFEKWRQEGRGHFDMRPEMSGRLSIARRRQRK